jgi:hypothetical protein
MLWKTRGRANRLSYIFIWKHMEGMNKKGGHAVGLVYKFSTIGRRVTFSHVRETAYAVRTVSRGSIGCR